MGFWELAVPAVSRVQQVALGHKLVGNGPSLMASDQVASALRSILYIVKNLHKNAIFKKKDDGEEKRMPAEFFPLKLIFSRCVFSVSIMTVLRRDSSPGQEGSRPVSYV